MDVYTYIEFVAKIFHRKNPYKLINLETFLGNKKIDTFDELKSHLHELYTIHKVINVLIFAKPSNIGYLVHIDKNNVKVSKILFEDGKVTNTQEILSLKYNDV
jgi:hypothetical protein